MPKTSYEVISFILVVIALILLLIILIRQKPPFGLLSVSDSINILILFALILTMYYVGQQASKTAESVYLMNAQIEQSKEEIKLIKRQTIEAENSTNILKANIEIQNQPYLNQQPFFWYNEEIDAIRLRSIRQCFGKSPVHEATIYRDILFKIHTPKELLDEITNNKTKKIGVAKYQFYKKGVLNRITDSLKNNPDIDDDGLKGILNDIKNNPKNEHISDRNFDVPLKIEKFSFYGNISE